MWRVGQGISDRRGSATLWRIRDERTNNATNLVIRREAAMVANQVLTGRWNESGKAPKKGIRWQDDLSSTGTVGTAKPIPD